MDKDLRDDMLKLVKYRVLFVKREYETAFYDHEDVIEDNLDGSALTAWKVADFIQELKRDGAKIPPKWRDTYPPKEFRGEPVAGGDFQQDDNGTHFNGFREEDRKYLRVSFEVLERYPRERFKYEEQHIKILEEMRDNMPPKP